MAWGEADITAIKRLSDMGFKVTVTGGLALEDLPLFKGYSDSRLYRGP